MLPSSTSFSIVRAVCLSAVAAGGVGFAGDEPERIFRRPVHQLVEDQVVRHELTATPLPFLDWGTVLPGFVEYVRKSGGAIVALDKPHDLRSPDEIRAAPFAIASGVRIRAQPARKGGAFHEELFPPNYPWEENCNVQTLTYDEDAKLYRLWYRTKRYVAYAESSDFKTWARPLLPHVAYEKHSRTNLVGVINAAELANGPIRSVEEARPGFAGAFFVDPSAPAGERCKCTFLAHLKTDTATYAKQTGRPISAMTGGGSTVLFGAVSGDGVGWRVLPKPIMLHDADTLTVATFDRALQRYVMYTRRYELTRRCVARAETADFTRWPLPVNLLTAGPAEPPTEEYYASGFANYPGRSDLRTMLCTVYDQAVDSSVVRLAVSRDGRGFHFLPGPPVVKPDPPGEVDSGFVFAFPSLVRRTDGRMVAFYDVHRTPHKFPRHGFGGSNHYAAWWPADRLAAIEAPGQGEFTTAPLRLGGRRIVLNLQADRSGGIQAELRDERFRPIAGRSFAESTLLCGDHPAAALSWHGQTDLSPQRGRVIYLRFRLRAAKLFSIAAVD